MFRHPMKYIVVNRTDGSEGIAFLKSGRAGIPSPSNPARLFDTRDAAEKHAMLIRSMLGGMWAAKEAVKVDEKSLIAA